MDTNTMKTNEYVSLPVGTIKGLLRIAGNDVFRPNLAGIHFHPAGFAVATNGHCILALKIPTFEDEGFTAPRGELEAAIKGQKPRASVIITETMLGSRPYTCSRQYPDWMRPLLPRAVQLGEPIPVQYFDCEYMEAFRRAFDDIGDCKDSRVFIEPDAAMGCAIIRTGAHILAGIMPMRAGKEWNADKHRADFLGVQS